MAIFSKKDKEEKAQGTKVETDVVETDVAAQDQEAQAPVVLDVPHSGIGNKGLIVPRISEKAGFLGKFNKYVFTVHGDVNKVEVRDAVEKMYGVKVDRVNMVAMKGKTRRFGRRIGRKSDFKKAIVTLTKDSKQIDIVEPS